MILLDTEVILLDTEVILLDTNVLSEVFKPVPSKLVLSWLARQEPSAVFITSVTEIEVLVGLDAMSAGKRKSALAAAVNKALADEFANRILPFDSPAAKFYPGIFVGRATRGRPISEADGMIAAVAKLHGAVLATRNVRDF